MQVFTSTLIRSNSQGWCLRWGRHVISMDQQFRSMTKKVAQACSRSEDYSNWTDCPKHSGYWETGVMTPTGSAMLLRKKESRPASRAERPAQSPSNTTSDDTKAATGSRSCSAASKTGGASQHATTGAQPSSCPPSLSPQPYCSGYEY